MEDRKPGDAVRRMEQSAGEGERVEDLRTLVERVDVDGAVREGAGAVVPLELGDHGVKMLAGAGKDGNAPRLRATGRERADEPLLDDAADVAGLLRIAVGAWAAGVDVAFTRRGPPYARQGPV